MALDKIIGIAAHYQMLLPKCRFNLLFKVLLNAKPLDKVNHVQTLHWILANKFLEYYMLSFLQQHSLFGMYNILKCKAVSENKLQFNRETYSLERWICTEGSLTMIQLMLLSKTEVLASCLEGWWLFSWKVVKSSVQRQ